jgi:hypothetical protein
MADDDPNQGILAELEHQLEQSRQQQVRIKNALSRALLILRDDRAG